MFELLYDPNAWAALVTLTALEIILGIDIGSITVEEIGLSIVAELVQVRRSDKHAAVRSTHAACASPVPE